MHHIYWGSSTWEAGQTGDAWGQVEQNKSAEAHKLDPVHELFYVWWPNLPNKVLFEQSSEASERANHMDILQKLILDRGHIKGKDLLQARTEGEGQEEARLARRE